MFTVAFVFELIAISLGLIVLFYALRENSLLLKTSAYILLVGGSILVLSTAGMLFRYSTHGGWGMGQYHMSMMGQNPQGMMGQNPQGMMGQNPQGMMPMSHQMLSQCLRDYEGKMMDQDNMQKMMNCFHQK